MTSDVVKFVTRAAASAVRAGNRFAMQIKPDDRQQIGMLSVIVTVPIAPRRAHRRTAGIPAAVGDHHEPGRATPRG